MIPSFLTEFALHTGTVIDAVIVGNLIGVDALSAVTLSTLANFLVANDSHLASLVEDYIFINILGLPIISLTVLTCEFMSVDNNPDLGAWMFGIAAVVNIIMNILLIKFAGLGIQGAAAATVIATACGLTSLISYARAKNRMLRFYLSGVVWLKNIFEALKVGLPRVTLEIMQALQIFILNTAVLQMLGVEAMEIYAVCTNTLIIAELLAGGIISVIPNICDALYGEKDYFAIRPPNEKSFVAQLRLDSNLNRCALVIPRKNCDNVRHGKRILAPDCRCLPANLLAEFCFLRV